MRYEIPVYLTTSRGATNKGMIMSFVPARVHDAAFAWAVCDAENDAAAFAYVCRTVRPNDKRNVSGKTYVRKYRVTAEVRAEGGIAPQDRLPQFKMGDRVKLHSPFTGCDLDPRTDGAISEVVSPTYFAIALDGYSNPFVDFTIREFASSA